MFPKGLVSVPEGGAVSKKGPKSLLVELDERDTGQDLTGAWMLWMRFPVPSFVRV